MSQETPRYRCATERGFLPEGSHIIFAKYDRREGVGARVEQDDEFFSEGEPAAWWDPVNDAAIARVEARMQAGQRSTVNAPAAVSNTPLKPPRSGLNVSMLQPDRIDDNLHASSPGPREPTRAAPRRRAAAASN